MKMKIYLLTVLFVAVSCQTDIIEEEQYQKVIYLLSSDYNIFKYSHAVNDSLTRGYLTVGSGGTRPLDKDVTVELELDTDFLDAYNHRNFDTQDKYAKLLDPVRYVLPSYSIVLRRGEANATTFFPVEVDANGLSPDSTYMIPLRIKSSSDYTINEEKNTVLYQIELKNKYTESRKNTYSMKGTLQPDGGLLSGITAVKTMTPISRNKVRIFPENRTSSTSLSTIENQTILIIIDEDNTLRLRPYKNVFLEQLDNNRYNDVDEIFHLNYRYKLSAGANWITVTETLTRIK